MNSLILGYVFFSTEVASLGRALVANAVRLAGLDDTQVKDLAPRNVFIRAIRRLQQTGVILNINGSDGVLADRVKQDGEIAFQLSRRYVEERGVRYDQAAFIKFDKESGQIICENVEIKRLAENLYTSLAGIYTTTDLHSLTGRLIDKTGAKRITLRPGVYYVARKYGDVLTKIKAMYDALGYKYHTYSIAPTEDSKALIRAVVEDIKSGVASVKSEIESLRAEPDGISTRLAKQRLRDLKESLKQYKELAASLGVSFKSLVDESGEAGKIIQFAEAGDDATALGALLQSGNELPALFTDLIEASELVPVNLQQAAEVAPVMAGSENE